MSVYIVHTRPMIAFLLIGFSIVGMLFLAMALNTIRPGGN